MWASFWPTARIDPPWYIAPTLAVASVLLSVSVAGQTGRRRLMAGYGSPLSGLLIQPGDGAASAVAVRLLISLGARTHRRGKPLPGNARGADADWDASGLARLTGWPDRPPLRPAGAPATVAAACASSVELLSERIGRIVRVDGPRLLSQRACILGLGPAGTVSAGGSARLLPAADGWCVLNLARHDDHELIPALTGDDAADDPWVVAARWIATQPRATVQNRTVLLGMAAAAVAGNCRGDLAWQVRARGSSRPPTQRLVVNLGSLWAAPLCAQLLCQAGYRVIDLEAPSRPDGARLGTPGFYALLHTGHERVEIDVASAAGRSALRELLREAAVVITGSRTEALDRLGATRSAVGAQHDQIWVSITGYGRASNRIAFGDDAAAAGGLVAWDADGPVFVGDAIADPLTGLMAATATFATLTAGGSWDIDLALAGVAAIAARAIAR